MILLLDACVLYPTVLREILMGVAKSGLFKPAWSARILEEWARAAGRRGDEAIARVEIALLRAAWPQALTDVPQGAEAAYWLPDPDDRHVMAAAVLAGAEGIITLNIKDFPVGAMNEAGLIRHHPDAFLRALHDRDPVAVRAVVEAVHLEAERLSGGTMELRALMKRAQLPRLGKALAATG